MLKFKNFTIEDYKTVTAFRQNSDMRTCELTAGVLFMWRNFYRPSFSVYDDTLIIKCRLRGKRTVFFYPLGKNVPAALDEIENYCLKKHGNLIFLGVEEFLLDSLKTRYGELISYEFHRKWSDYVYDAAAFRTFSGKKYSGQRNHINKFLSLYPDAEIKELTTNDIPRALDLLEKYAEEKNLHGLAKEELVHSAECTRHFKELGLFGVYVEKDGEMISYTLGEKCGKTHVIHIEKALRRYEGLYPFTANAYAKTTSAEFINREDDSGDEGLRINKLQYHPIELLSKYTVTVSSPQNGIKAIPTLKAEGLVLSSLTEEDGKRYFELNVDDELNKYWGYDYRKDIKKASPEAFSDMVKRDFRNKTSFSFAVRKDSEFIGEAVFYDFRFGGVCELGLRFFPEYQGRGYGKAVYRRVSDFLLYEVGMKKIVARCFRENPASAKMILSSGFVAVNEDEKMLYFEKTR